MSAVDFIYNYEGSIVILTPLTTDAEDWIEANLPEDTPQWGKGVAIETGYADDVFYGIVTEGLILQRYA